MTEKLIPTKTEWMTKGKTIRELIAELQSFDDQDLEVKISIDDGESFKKISIVERENEQEITFCGLTNCE